MGFLNDFFNMFKGKKEKRNNSEDNNGLENMKDIPLSFGEDSGSLENKEDEEK